MSNFVVFPKFIPVMLTRIHFKFQRSPIYLLLVIAAVMISSVFSAPHHHLGASPPKAAYAQPQYRLYFPQHQTQPQLYNYHVPYPAQYQYAHAYPYYAQVAPYV